MTVGKVGSRKPVSTGCGVSGGGKTGGTTERKSVSSGCGSSSTGGAGWKPKAGGGKKTTSDELLERAGRQTGGRKTTSTGCGAAPSKPTKPSPKPTSSGCGTSTPSRPTTTPRTTRTGC